MEAVFLSCMYDAAQMQTAAAATASKETTAEYETSQAVGSEFHIIWHALEYSYS